MLDGVPKKEYPKLFYRYLKRNLKEFFEVLSDKTSLKLYLAHNYPSFYKLKLKDGEILKWKGESFRIPKIVKYPELLFAEFIFLLSGQYSIPECHVAQGDIVFDVGAHFGFFSYYALQKGAKKIYAFEPNPYVFEILKEHANIWDKEKIEPFCLALSSFEGEAILTIPKGKELYGWATINEAIKRPETEIRKIKTTTIDRFVKENNIEKVDFIKIDTEGSEREIIKGAKETIRKFKPKMAISAYHLPDDKEKIPELVLSIRDDYRFKLVNKGEEDLFFF
ncbi:MAG: FkbM family methyltransferase [Archaeoglobaceae archaeon]